MDITIKIDLTENTIKALHGVVEAVTTPKGVRVSLNDLANAANAAQRIKNEVGDWLPQDTRYTDNAVPAKAEPVAPDAVEEAPKQEETKPAAKPAAKKAAPKKTAEPAKEEPKTEEPAKAETPKKEDTLAPTKADVTKALTDLQDSEKGGKAAAVALVKKNSTNGKLSGVDPAKYAEIIEAVNEVLIA